MLTDTGLGETVTIDKVRQFFDHPGFVAPFEAGVRAAIAGFRADGIAPEAIRVLFSTHSVPLADAQRSGPRDVDWGEGGAYAAQHLAVAERIMIGARGRGSDGRAGRLGARLPVPLRPAVAALARARHQRRHRDASGCRHPGDRHRAARLRERPHGGAVGPRHRGDGGIRRGGDPRGADAHARRRPGLRVGPGRSDPRADGRHAGRRSGPTRPTLGPWFDVCRPGCCENIRAGFKPAAAGIAP